MKSSLSLNINMMHALASRHGWKCISPYQMQKQTPEDSVCLERVRGGNCPSLLHSQATWGHKEETCKYIFSRQVWISPFLLTFLFIFLLIVTFILPKFTCKQGCVVDQGPQMTAASSYVPSMPLLHWYMTLWMHLPFSTGCAENPCNYYRLNLQSQNTC